MLAVRLFANIFAGHMVLAMILLFIVTMAPYRPVMFWGVTASSVIGVTLAESARIVCGIFTGVCVYVLDRLVSGLRLCIRSIEA